MGVLESMGAVLSAVPAVAAAGQAPSPGQLWLVKYDNCCFCY